jgi:site-specific DNA recombinase
MHFSATLLELNLKIMKQKKMIYRKPQKKQRHGKRVAKMFEEKFDYKKALLYTRVSSLSQKTQGHGLESQEQRCRQYAQQKGYQVEKVFQDSYTGEGDFFNRTGISALLKYLDERPHERYVIIFDDLKRFARDTQFHLKLRIEFKSRGAQVECPNFTFDETPEGEYIELIIAGQAELERKQNKRQVIQKMKARLESGYWPFGARKGYRNEWQGQHGLISIPTQQGLQVLKPALEMFATGVLSRKIDVCKYLAERGFWKNKSPERYMDRITTILEDPFYAGEIQYLSWGVERREGKHEGIISKETFALIQKRLGKENLGARVRVDTTADFPLRGLILCAGCGVKLTAAWSKGRNQKYGYYLCQTKGCSIGTRSIVQKKIEDEFSAVMKNTRLKEEIAKLILPAFIEAWAAEIVDTKERERITEQDVKKIKDKMRKLTEEILSAKSEELKHVYETQLEHTANELRDLEGSLSLPEDKLNIPYQTALARATQMLKNPYFAWENADVYEKHRLFFFIFEGRLAYSKSDGYQTTDYSAISWLFEEFVTENSYDVLPVGIEPTSAPPQGAVLSIERRERVRD